ncbi:MAG: 2-oxoacid ferredoxin oxidoreductase, partial [Planctomycetota bacterium]
FSPCVTFNKVNTYPWFRERVYKLEEEEHDPTNFDAAMKKSYEFGDKIPIGLLYKEERGIYEDTDPVLNDGPLVDQKMGLDRETFNALLAEMS